MPFEIALEIVEKKTVIDFNVRRITEVGNKRTGRLNFYHVADILSWLPLFLFLIRFDGVY